MQGPYRESSEHHTAAGPAKYGYNGPLVHSLQLLSLQTQHLMVVTRSWCKSCACVCTVLLCVYACVHMCLSISVCVCPCLSALCFSTMISKIEMHRERMCGGLLMLLADSTFGHCLT